MHDVLEGAGPFCLKNCLRHWILNPLPLTAPSLHFSAELLNRRIQKFHYGFYDLKNKPSARFTQQNLREQGNYSTKQRAAQQWCLLRMFPLIMGDLIPYDDPYYLLLLEFLDLMDILFCPKTTIALTYYYEEKLYDFFTHFEQLFPGIHPINKYHHLLHYGEAMRLHGPTSGFSCMRYEAFHNPAKRVARINHNFINIAKSVASYYALLFCSEMLDPMAFEERFEMGKCVSVSLNSLSIDVTVFDDTIPVLVPFWVKIKGWVYRRDTIVILKSSSETEKGVPHFGRIIKLITQNNKYFAIIAPLTTVNYSTHFHAYHVKEESLCAHFVRDLSTFEFEPLWLLKSFCHDSFSYVAPRYVI